MNRIKVPLTTGNSGTADSPSTKMLLALSRLGKPFYEGTVPRHVKARRRAANKVARKARQRGRR